MMQKDSSSGPGKVKGKAGLKRSPQMSKAHNKHLSYHFLTILFCIPNEVLGLAREPCSSPH